MQRRAFCSVVSILFALAIGCGIGIPDIPEFRPPVVPVNPDKSKQKTVLILHKTHEQTPEFSRMKIDLQTNGDPLSYITKNGHSVFIIDVESTDSSGKTLDVITRTRSLISSKRLPVIVIGSKGKSGHIDAVSYAESLPNESTASDVISLVKRNGG